MKKDAAHVQTDKEIFRLNKLASAEYKRAAEDLRKPLLRFLKKHEKHRQRLLEELLTKKITKAEMRRRRLEDLMDEDFLLLLDDDADRMSKATGYLWKKIIESIPGIYAENYNWGLWRAETLTGKSLGELLTAEIVRQMWKKNPDMIRMPGKSHFVATSKKAGALERFWQRQLLNTAISMTADLPFPIEEIARQIIEWIWRQNFSHGRDYVTTTATGVENKGRTDAGKKAKDELMRGWVAIMDERTRIAHRILDGTYVGMEEPWVYKGDKVWFPGDPSAPAYLVRNCRCTVDFRLKSEIDGSVHKNERFMGQSYEEWKAGKPIRVK